jgi:hypothetical protein
LNPRAEWFVIELPGLTASVAIADEVAFRLALN